MPDMASRAGWWGDISRRVQEREMRRQILYNEVRRTAHNHFLADLVQKHVPAIVRELFKMMMGSLIVFWLLGKALEYFAHANPLYLFASLGLLFSLQVTYYKYRLSRDPAYTIPKCKCAGRRNDDTESVLKSRQSSIFMVPNSVFGAVFYSSLLVTTYLHYTRSTILLAAAAVVVSAYLLCVMVVKIGSLCANCVNVGALNILILIQLLR